MSPMPVPGEAGQTGKSNPRPEYMSVPARTDLCPFYDGKGPVKPTRHQASGWPPQDWTLVSAAGSSGTQQQRQQPGRPR